MAKIVYRQMPDPRELSQQIPTPGQKLGCKGPRVGANCWCKSPGVRGGVVMDEIDTCIMYQSIPSLTIPSGDPRDSHILVAQGSGFRSSVLLRGLPGGLPGGSQLNQSKSSIILKKARFLLCLLNN